MVCKRLGQLKVMISVCLKIKMSACDDRLNLIKHSNLSLKQISSKVGHVALE